MLRIGLIADGHYAATDTPGRARTEGAKRLSLALEDLAKRDLEYIFTLGDMIDHVGDSESERAHLKEVGKLLRTQACAPTHAVLGNHDVGCFDKATCLAALGQRRKRAYYAFDYEPWRLIVLDTNFHADGSDITPAAPPAHWRENYLGAEQLRWLRHQVLSVGERPVLVFAHANLDPRPGPVDGLDDHNVRDCRQALEILSMGGNVHGVIQGHCHSGCLNEINGIRFITLKALCAGEDTYSAGAIYLGEDGGVYLNGLGEQPSWPSWD
jgi:3',5'-cyclic AMP phosphodiesterase CpdA